MLDNWVNLGLGLDFKRFDSEVLMAVSLGESGAEDLTRKPGYLPDVGLGIDGGIRTFSLELDDADGLDSDIEYDGVYAQTYLRFRRPGKGIDAVRPVTGPRDSSRTGPQSF